MKKRRAKSRMTSFDLDAELKLQRDYTELRCSATHLMEYAVTCKDGITDAAYAIRDDEYLDVVADVILNMATRIKELEQQLEQKKI